MKTAKQALLILFKHKKVSTSEIPRFNLYINKLCVTESAVSIGTMSNFPTTPTKQSITSLSSRNVKTPKSRKGNYFNILLIVPYFFL